MSIDTRAVASWGMFPDAVLTTKAPFAATWGLKGALAAPSVISRIKAIYLNVWAMWTGNPRSRGY
jgi:hypothetical protein